MFDPDRTARIDCNNIIFSAWEQFALQRQFGSGISTFSFSPVENVQGKTGLQIQPGDAISIKLAGLQAFTGWVTQRAGAYDAKSHSLVIQGESKTRDLAHSSIPLQPGTFDGSTLEQAARAVLAPHGIGLVMSNPPASASQPFKNLSVQPGETVAEFLNRIAAARNCFITDDEYGNVVIGQLDSDRSVCALLSEGSNILSASFKLEDPSAHIWYKTSGISQTPGDDDTWPPRAWSATGTVPAIRPNVTQTFIAPHPENPQNLQSAVRHVVMTGVWPIMEIAITVVGWKRGDGKLWATAPDASPFVAVQSPMIFPGQTSPITLGIQGVTFQQDSQNGTTTTLMLRHPDALTITPSSDLTDPGSPSYAPSVSPDAPDWQASNSSNAAGGAQ